jgi:hypothetical protein
MLDDMDRVFGLENDPAQDGVEDENENENE